MRLAFAEFAAVLVDTHCHIDSSRFDGDRADLLARARQRGVGRFITIGCDLQSSMRALGLASVHSDVWASIGVHPHDASQAGDHFEDALRSMAGHPRCVAIGECGLDFHYDRSPRDVQAAAASALKILSLPDRGRAMGQTARVNAKKKYCANDVIPIYEAYYQKILGTASAAKA